MQRRSFLTLLGGAAAAWPLGARAQRDGRVRRVGFLNGLPENDPEARARRDAFHEVLTQLGWADGRNVRIDYRWGVRGKIERAAAAEIVHLAPNVIVALGTPVVQMLLSESRTIPIVFVGVGDPLATGLVQSLAHPGASVTGFTNFDLPMAGKWLQIIKEVAPNITRVLVIHPAENISASGQVQTIEAAGLALGVQVMAADATAPEIERSINALAEQPNGSLLVLPGTGALANRDLIVGLAVRHRLPAMYAARPYIASGGLMSYGIHDTDMYRGAATYVDRILRGEKPGDLPVQNPTKFEFVLNLKTAKGLGFDLPAVTLLRADEVIE